MLVGLANERAVEALESEMAEVCGMINAATSKLVSLIASALETGAWQQAGMSSPTQWICWKCGVSPARARRLLALAKRLEEMPTCAEAFGNGELSEDQMAVVVRHTPSAYEADVAEFAKFATVSQLTRTLRKYVFDLENQQVTDPDEPEVAQASFGHTDSGTWRLSVELAADDGAVAERALAEARSDLEAAGHKRPSWSDALVAIFESYLDNADATGASRERTTLLIHVRADAEGHNGAHLHMGPVLPDSQRRYRSCDARVRTVLETDGVPRVLSSASRIVPDHLRAVIEARDGGCREPGCVNTRWLQAHHIWHWEDGGPTVSSNLVTLCSQSHRKHHLGQLGISGNADDPNGLVFTDSRGRVLDPAGKPLPVTKLEPTGNWTHPSGERLDSWAVHFNAHTPKDPPAA